MVFFFFSSRRRHTRFSRDWSSDVCSSDLRSRRGPIRGLGARGAARRSRRRSGLRGRRSTARDRRLRGPSRSTTRSGRRPRGERRLTRTASRVATTTRAPSGRMCSWRDDQLRRPPWASAVSHKKRKTAGRWRSFGGELGRWVALGIGRFAEEPIPRSRESESVPFLFPVVGVVVVAVALPEAGLVAGAQLEAAEPLGALPEVLRGDNEAQRPAVIRLQRLAVGAPRDQRVVVLDRGERDVRGEALLRVRDDEARLGQRLDELR